MRLLSVGALMQAAALLEQLPNPSDADIDAAMSGNISTRVSEITAWIVIEPDDTTVIPART